MSSGRADEFSQKICPKWLAKGDHKEIVTRWSRNLGTQQFRQFQE
jgi:hypothetical protein